MKLIVVNYHYFREVKYPSGIYPVSANQLIKQLKLLRKYFQFISQQDVIRWKTNGCPTIGNYCLITFDDGLKEQMKALSILKKMEIPALFFVNTLPLQERKVLDVHQLHYIRSVVDDDQLLGYIKEEIGSDINFPTDQQVKQQYRYDSSLSGKIKYLINFTITEKQKSKLIVGIFEELVPDKERFFDSLYMNKDDIFTLAQNEMLGSHGHSHYPLTRMKLKDAIIDVETSCQYLEHITKIPIRSFAYPFGGKDAVCKSLDMVFRNTSVEIAFTMWRGINTSKNFASHSSLFLQRIDNNDAPGGKLNSTVYLPQNFN